MIEQYVMSEKYRPQLVADTILPERFKKIFSGYVESGNIPNIILSGVSGIGKTTIAVAMVQEIGSSCMVINASLDGTKETLRNEITNFTITKSLSGKSGKKYVILDEAEGTSVATQRALRKFMEEFSDRVGFILVVNNPYQLIDAIHSRCGLIEFNYTSKEKGSILKDTFRRVCWILDQENIKYDKQVVVKFVSQKFPDIRKMLVELQKFSSAGLDIDESVLISVDEKAIREAIQFVKDRNFTAVRDWITNHPDITDDVLYKYLYEHGKLFVKPDSVPTLILIINEAQRYSSSVANRAINTAAALYDISLNCEFK